MVYCCASGCQVEAKPYGINRTTEFLYSSIWALDFFLGKAILFFHRESDNPCAHEEMISDSFSNFPSSGGVYLRA
jgi:hypothetical protein